MKLNNLLSLSMCIVFQMAISQNEEISNSELLTIDQLLPEENTSQLVAIDQIEKMNQIEIFQSGSDNNIDINVASESSDIRVLQNGSGNQINLDVTAKRIEARVVQNGEDHLLSSFSEGTEVFQLNTLQQGSNTEIITHGENTISEKIDINLIGNDRSVIIRNFK